jgi:hypothetical protein
MAAGAASNDIGMVGRLLGERDVNAITFGENELPGSVVRRPLKCSLLDVAVGSGSVEMAKYQLEFHRARPTRETVKQSISSGNLELFKMMRERLPEAEFRLKDDLREVAAEFHQEEVLAWFFRDATIFERELLGVLALEGKLADSLVLAFENGFGPWWYLTREVSLKWRASAELKFVPAPAGFSVEGGWWRSKSGDESALSSLGSEGDGMWILPKSIDGWDLTYAALPAGVKTIGAAAFEGCAALARLRIPPSVVAIGAGAFRRCSGLTWLEIPSSVTTIGDCAFAQCSHLVGLKIPHGMTTVGSGVFRNCTSLLRLKIPSSVRTIEKDTFWVVRV